MKSFYCEKCNQHFPATPEGIVEGFLLDYFYSKCPWCKAIVYLARPLLDKPINEWNGGDWIAAIAIGALAYKALNA
jgi:hypothetical protein